MRPNIQTSALRGARICQSSHASFSPISLVALRSSFPAHTNTSSATASTYRLIAPTIAERRSFSSSPKQQSEKPQEPVTTSAEAASNDTSDGISGFYPPEANPPASTRPPPLDLPTKGPDTSQFTYLFSTGKAYLSFYKAGLKAIITNTKMVYGSAPPPPPPPQENKDGSSSSTTTAPAVPLQLPEKGTRAELVLHHRWRHDIRRLPLFALMLLICGEFTPFVVLVFPSVVPYTCRIPSQVTKLRKNQERRRTISRSSTTRPSWTLKRGAATPWPTQPPSGTLRVPWASSVPPGTGWVSSRLFWRAGALRIGCGTWRGMGSC